MGCRFFIGSPANSCHSTTAAISLAVAILSGSLAENLRAQSPTAPPLEIPGDKDAGALVDSAIMAGDKNMLVLQGSPPEVAQAVVQMENGHLAEAEESLRVIIDRETRKARPDVMMLAGMESNLGIVLRRQHRNAEAEEVYRRALARVEGYSDRNQTVYGLCTNFANLLDSQGKYQEAEALYRRTIAAADKEGAQGLDDSLGAQINLAHVLYEQDKTSELAMFLDKLQSRITRFNYTGSEIDRRFQELKALIASGKRIDQPDKRVSVG